MSQIKENGANNPFLSLIFIYECNRKNEFKVFDKFINKNRVIKIKGIL